MTTLKTHCLALLSLILLGCSPSDPVDLPTERPIGTVSGVVIDNVIANAQINIYGFTSSGRGTRLASATSNENGEFSLDIQAADQVVLVEVTGGSYIEQTTGAQVTLADGQVLRALANYHSGEDLEVMVSPLTHIATGLAEYKMANGLSIDQAHSEASTDIYNFFNINITNTRPYLFSNTSDPAALLDDSLLYAFYLAGISNWTLWASNENDVTPHTNYTSIALAQILYNDIRSDGLLNGVGTDKDQTGLMPLAFGVTPLNADVYRGMFSLHMLAFANSSQNNTSIAENDLLPAAQNIAQHTGLVLGASDPFDIESQSPSMTTLLVDGQTHGGLLSFNIDIGGILGAKTLSLSVDNSLVVTKTNPANKSLIILDTTDYADGDHELLLTAIDALNNQSQLRITAYFDNTAPVINVTSAPITNQASAQVSGAYSDNISGVQNIKVLGQDATLFADGTWVATVSLVSGENTLPISVIDFAGNQYDTQTTMYLDTFIPVIDTTNKHSTAKFSNGDGSFYEAELQNDNTGFFLYFETDHVDLSGVSITREELTNNTIPYFALAVSDQRDANTVTDPADMTVIMQYERNGSIQNAWHELTAINGEYLIPLASEVLTTDWHQSLPSDQHKILIQVSDPAGNQSSTEFIFHGDFYVPAFAMSTIDDLSANLFTNTAFADRINLNNLEFPSNAYTFTNATGKSFYLSLEDLSAHNTSQTVEQLVREHLVKLKTATEWRIGLMKPDTTNQCPDLDPVTYSPDGWSYPTAIYNWTGVATGWQQENLPAPSYGGEESAPDDNLPQAPAATSWTDVAHFDQEFKVNTNSSSDQILTYGYDYIVNRFSFSPSAGYVFGWILQDLDDNKTTQCAPKRYFQQRTVYAYESLPDYPKPVLSEITLSGLPTFSTTGFIVHDNDTGLDIAPSSGWYLIPAGHSISINKLVTTPVLTLYSDDISDITNFPSYTPNWHDKTLGWVVDRNIEISVVHNAGEPNIPSMPRRTLSAGQDRVTYTISR
jgi:hypothetical protein